MEKITVLAADATDATCAGLGILGDPERGTPVAFRCTGHTPDRRCETACYSPASVGAHFADQGGQCYVVCGDGVNTWTEGCFLGQACPGDTLVFPGSDAPVAAFEPDEYD